MNDQVLDNDLQLSNSRIEVRWAGFWIRVGASLIDFIVYIPAIAFNMYNIYSLKSLPLQLLITLILIVYKPLLEFRYGATVGKMAVGIKVVNNNYSSISITQAITRYIPWLIGQVISIYGTILLFQNPDFLSTTNWIEVGTIQNEIIPRGVNYIGSVILLVSCIFIAFTDNKQGLHDMLAGTYCIYK